MDEKGNLAQFSPLDQIRQTEAEITRKIAAAHAAAEQVMAKARLDAGAVKKQGLEDGHREGQARYHEILVKAEEEAKALVAQAQSLAGSLRHKGDTTMESAVRSAVALVIGDEGNG